MRWLVGVSLKFRLLVVGLGAGLLFFGMTQFRTLPVDVLPEFTPSSVEIQTEALGLSAEEVAQMITVPLEQDLLAGVPWLDVIQSQSLPGLSSITLTFKPGTDLVRARQVVGERMTLAFALPHVSRPPNMLQPVSSSSRVMMIGLSSKELSPIALSVLARWTVGPRLTGVPGVAKVAIWGNRDRQLQVQVDPQLLRRKGVSLQQVLETTGNAMFVSSLSFVEASTPGTGGFIETANQRLGIWHVFPISSPEGLAQMPIEDTALRLSDVARVVEDHPLLIGDAVAADGGEQANLLLVVEKFPGANTLAVTYAVEQALAAMRPGLSGVEIDPSIYRPASYIERAIDNVTRSLLVGGALVALVVGGLLFNWRTVLVGLIAIPLSLVSAVLVLYLRGETFNAITLAGLLVALGVVVDDAIAGSATIAGRLSQHRHAGDGRSTATVILEAVTERRGAIVYATLIVLLGVLPAFFFSGPSGPFYLPVAVSYALAVLASMLVAFTVTPALWLVLAARAPGGRRGSPLTGWLQREYGKALASAMRAPRLALAAAGLLLVAGVATLPSFKPSLVPAFKEPNLLVRVSSAPGTSQTEMNRILGRAARELRTMPGVRDVAAHSGRAVMSDRVVDVNSGELWVSLDPAADHDATLAAVQRTMNGYPGLRNTVRGYLQEQSQEVAAEPASALTVRVYGDNRDVLGRTAEDVRQALSGIAGVAAARVRLPPDEPTVQVEVDLTAAQRRGLKPGDVRRAAATLLSGISTGSLFEDQKVFDVVVWGTPETRRSLSSIRDLVIDSAWGGHVRLGDVAQVRIASAPAVVQHEAVRSYLDVRADVRGRSLASVAGDIEQRLQGLSFPMEYHAEVLRDYAAREAAQSRILGVATAALLGIFLLLHAAIGSWRLAALALVALPAAVSGGVLTALAGGGSLTLGALLGLLAVFGIASRNGLAVIRHIQYLDREQGEPTGPWLVARAAGERLVPILTTALATALALLPFVLFGDIPGQEIARQMAPVVWGGLVTSTLVNLFILPIICAGLLSPAPIGAPAPSPARHYAVAGRVQVAQVAEAQSDVAPGATSAD